MLGKTRKAFLLAFVMVTVVLASAMLYSFNEYTGIFKAVRSLEISIEDFEFSILDPTSAKATTTLTVNNTSPYEFVAEGIQQRINMNGIYYIGTSWKEGITKSNPYRIAPDSCSNISLTFNLDLEILGTSNPELVELLFDSSVEKTWQVAIFAFMEGPLLGQFRMTTARDISTI
jgi:hypothetical protein